MSNFNSTTESLLWISFFENLLLQLHFTMRAEILEEIPANVTIHIVGIDRKCFCGGVVALSKQRIRHGKFFEAVSLVVKRCMKIGMTTANTNINAIPMFGDSFDLAICYHIHSALLLRYVDEKVCAQRKIAWIHNDFYASGYPVHRLRKHVEKYDEFVAVSQKVEKEFRELCPWYQGGISTAYNYLDDDEIITRSKEPIEENIYLLEKKVKLLTVGRFTEQKGIDYAIEAASLLKKEKVDFHWFLIGYGEQESLYCQLIKKHNVEDCFTILGKKTNPYPYIKNCDIYVQPSRHEAFGLVVLEAKILKRPIVCTDFDGADEQIKSGVNGIIVPLNDTEALAEALSSLIRSREAREMFTRELEKWSPKEDLQEITKHFD